jgi:hypothetical protein
MSLSKVALALRDAPANDIASVLAIMTSIEGALHDGDGVVWFHRLYREVTERVARELQTGTFEDRTFIARLDVVFANYCFRALQTFLDGASRAPRAWSPLFEANERRGLARLQFALAGMNAHINRDLMRAVVDVCQEWGIAPHDDSPQKRDFDRLNPMLADIEQRVHAWYLKSDGALFEEVENLLGSWSLVEARSTAWHQARGLWAIRQASAVEEAYLFGVDKFVGFTSRSLLIPLPKRSFLSRWFVRARAARRAVAFRRVAGDRAEAVAFR